MKKFVSVLLLLACIVCLASCASPSSDSDDSADRSDAAQGPVNPIDYGKKYMLNEKNYYVFNEDQTGYYEHYYEGTYYTASGRVEFVWREAADGGVYLFEIETHYHEDHTEGEGIFLSSCPLYFSEDFFVGTRIAYSEYKVTYVKEGSELEALLKD